MDESSLMEITDMSSLADSLPGNPCDYQSATGQSPGTNRPQSPADALVHAQLDLIGVSPRSGIRQLMSSAATFNEIVGAAFVDCKPDGDDANVPCEIVLEPDEHQLGDIVLSQSVINSSFVTMNEIVSVSSVDLVPSSEDGPQGFDLLASIHSELDVGGMRET